MKTHFFKTLTFVLLFLLASSTVFSQNTFRLFIKVNAEHMTMYYSIRNELLTSYPKQIDTISSFSQIQFEGNTVFFEKWMVDSIIKDLIIERFSEEKSLGITAIDDHDSPGTLKEYANNTENSPIDSLWYLEAINFGDCYENNATTIIAIIDGGVDIDHIDLRNNIWINQKEVQPFFDVSPVTIPNIIDKYGTLRNALDSMSNGMDEDANGYKDDHFGWNFVDNNNDVFPENDNSVHGTHIAGINHFIAENALLMPLKCFSEEDSSAHMGNIIESAVFAGNNNAHTATCAFGYYISDTIPNETLKILTRILYETMQYADNVLFACSAGNDATNNDEKYHFPSHFSANYPFEPVGVGLNNVISVGGINEEYHSVYNFGNAVDLMAPAVRICSTIPSNLYGMGNGTSRSAAMVSAAAALWYSDNHSLSPAEIKQKIRNTATNYGLPCSTGGILTVCSSYTTCPDDRAALMALYNSTGGDNWTNNTNWGSNQPLNTWHGIQTNNDGCVISISLYHNNLVGTIPAEIGNLINLYNLELGGNQLGGIIPTEIGNLANLRNLLLHDNQLVGVIPSEIGNLSLLGYLELSGNQFGTIPAEIWNLTNLLHLGINGAQLSGTIPAEIGNLTNLIYLGLNDNQLNGSIPAEIINLTNLQRLCLSYNQLSGLIPSEICNLPNLIVLTLEGNNFGIENCPVIQCLIDRGGWQEFTHSPQNNGVYFNNCGCFGEISTDNQSVTTNTTFAVDVNTTELLENDDISAFQFTYTYDANLLQYEGTTNGTLASGAMVNASNSGVIYVSYASADALVGAGSLIRFTFTALDCGTTTPVISDFYYNETLIGCITNGTITSNSSLICGDLTGNGIVQAYDASKVVKFVVDPLTFPLTNCQLEAADVAETYGEVDEVDASTILQFVNHVIDELECGGSNSGKSFPIVDVDVKVVNNQLVFTSKGDLFAFKLVANENSEFLNEPIIKNFAANAKNITASEYKVAMASAFAINAGDDFMTIPLKEGLVEITLELRINGVTKIKIIPIPDPITIYPNPVRNLLTISGIEEPTVATVCSVSGSIMQITELNSGSTEINVNNLAKGVYILKLQTATNVVVKRFIKQ